MLLPGGISVSPVIKILRGDGLKLYTEPLKWIKNKIISFLQYLESLKQLQNK